VAFPLARLWLAHGLHRDPPRRRLYGIQEWLNINIRRSWSYTATMRVLPLLGTGLTPLLQWVVVPGLAFATVMGWERRRQRS